MKPIAKFVLYVAGICILAATFCPAAEPPLQVDVSIEIYELPQAKAVVWQKAFEDGSEQERQKFLADLRAKAIEGARTIGVGQRVCTLNNSSTVETVELYRYPTEFTTKDGFASPSAFEVNKVGCTMTVEVTSTEQSDTFAVDTNIRDVALLTTQHYAASKTDQPGSIEQPVFASQTVVTRFRAISGVSKLVSVYSPHKDDKSLDALRLVFVTVRPDR